MRVVLLVGVLALAGVATPARATTYEVSGVGCSAVAVRDLVDPAVVDVVVTGGPVAVLPPGVVGAPATDVVVHCDAGWHNDDGTVTTTVPVAGPPGVAASLLPPTLVRARGEGAGAPFVCGYFTWREPDGGEGLFPAGCAAAIVL
jgi:hypothetical protein